MPYKRKASKKSVKKYKRAKTKSIPRAVICYCPQICPDVMRVQLAYNTRQNSSGGGVKAIDDYVYRGNSLFDPDFAVGGQQPLGYDQWAAFYKRYRVRAAKVILQATSDSAINAGIGVTVTTTSSAITSRDEGIEAQYSKNMVLGGDTMYGVGKLEMYMPTNVIRGGKSDLVDYDPDLSALTSTNPTEQWFIHTYGYGLGSSGNNFEVNLDTKIIYYVEFYDRQTLSGS